MGCDIVFKINGNLRGGLSEEGQLSNQIVIKDSSLLSDAGLQGMNESLKRLKEVSLSNVVRELLSSDNVQIKTQLVSMIKNLQDASGRTVTPDVVKREGVVGNTKLHSLKYRWSGDLSFPNLSTPYDPDILLVDSFRNRGVNRSDIIYGTDANGNLVYVVEDSIRGVSKLYRHLKARDLILNKFEGNAELAALMPELAKVGKSFSSQQELLLDFITHKSEYTNILVDKGLFGLLNEIVKNLDNENRAGFQNPLDREFNAKLTPVSKNSKDSLITTNTFLDLVQKFEPELLEDVSKEDQKKPEVLTQLFEKFYESFEEFSGRLIEVRDKGLVVRRNFSSLELKEDFTYDTINEQVTEEEVYRGFHIYKYSDGRSERFLYSQDMLSPSSSATMYTSVDEIKAKIDERYSQRQHNSFTFEENFELGFRVIPAYERVNEIYTPKLHTPGSIVQVLDVELNKDTILDPKEEALFKGDKLLDDFYRVFQKQLTPDQFNQLREVIDSIEKAGIFTYLVNDRVGHVQSRRNLKDSPEFENILEEISKAKYKKFFIQSQRSGYTRIIPLSDTVTINQSYNRPSPIIDLMIEVIDTFNEKFKVGATLLTQDELSQQFPDVPAGTKAFIRDGKIYINGSIATSEDVIHEYTHLFLGALKAQNYDMYTKLLDRVMSSKDDRVESTKGYLRRIYPNLANSDLNEEVFVKLFADFLSGKRVSDMFTDVKAEVDSEMKSIFNLASDEDFNSLYRGRVKSIFQTFSKDIGKVGNGLDFSKGTVFRQAANWVADQIEKGDITERC